jgi:hypothetical protein
MLIALAVAGLCKGGSTRASARHRSSQSEDQESRRDVAGRYEILGGKFDNQMDSSTAIALI